MQSIRQSGPHGDTPISRPKPDSSQITPSGPECLVGGASEKSHRRTWAAKKRANPQGQTIVDIYAKKADAALRISFARRSHSRSASVLTPSLPVIEVIAAHSDGYSSR